ncbi:MAG TPA: ABC transporter ATP-binding protein [Chloroflexota bacterium]|nr:ABC transporter ATP-binding protein [Chloroflexota bacterium]
MSMHSAGLVYDVRDLVKTYKAGKIRANDGLSFTIQSGEIFGLLGPNGAGKTTLVGQLTGLLRPDSGAILLYGHDISRDSRFATEVVATLTQRPLPLSDLTVDEALTITGHLRGLSRADARGAATALIEQLGLGEARHKRLGKISGGQLRLASLATALIGDRPVLVLDEPTNELDPANRRMVWDLLLALKREQDRTIILVTHNVLEAERVIERVGIINHGRIIALGTPGELKARVDRRVRLDVILAEGQEDRAAQVQALGEAVQVTARHWQILLPREVVAQVVDRIVNGIGLDALDDFRVLTPSLEDVYLQLSGETLEGAYV